ncbi:hypothetical protein DERF_008368 [Dermatophagoides farinae]|uniref:glutaminyl-peptide cyclotransferase n=1 Tax=Dermatophagoides farinae TaxID=6954 RepID=A0A922I4A5_DERFA|nr:hypothetical protein DERF_008368 [Dermatophagoides farinae]
MTIINCDNNNKKNDDDKNIILDKSVNFFQSILEKILIPRSVNSAGHETVRQYIKNTLRDLNSRWHIEEDVFRTRTPAGQVKFQNIIATYVPEFGCIRSKSSLKRTILACHYDSLKSSLVKGHNNTDINQVERFTGATDAAVSCSMMIYLAYTMNDHLEKHWLHHFNSNRTIQLNTLQLIFFDGEEIIRSEQNALRRNKRRYKSKSPQSDSLFGSKHLANKWEKITNKIHEQRKRFATLANMTNMKRSSRYLLCDGQDSISAKQRLIDIQNENQNKKKNGKITEVLIISPQDYHTIDGIQLFILFDLIGGSGSPRFYNTNLNTSQHFQQLIQIEKSYLQFNNEKKTAKSMSGGSNKVFFQQNPAFMVSFVRDDHLPFVIRNVPALHLIPHPFPRTWHSMDDNVDNLNFNSIGRFTNIMQLFLLNFFRPI